MKRIWSPWRMRYIQSSKNKGCFFCEGIKCEDGVGNLIVYRGKTSFVILNRYPYTSGHLMVVPFEHVASLRELTPETRLDLMNLTAMAVEVLSSEYQAQGFNIGINIGEIAGAGILEHIHVHVVPRWGGDTNFMSTLGETRVLPEALETTYERIRRVWLRIYG